jgi:hypothetical protein
VSEYDVEESAAVALLPIVTYRADRYPATGPKRARRALRNSVETSRLVLRGESTPFSIPVEGTPISLWLDHNDEVFARFHDREPKWVGLYRGLDLEAEGRPDEAEGELRGALEAEVATGERPKVVAGRGKILDARIHLVLARILLDKDRVAEARAELRAARKGLPASSPGWLDAELDLVEARVELREGDAEAAYRRLKKLLTGRSAVASTEGYMLMAIAARRTGHAEEFDFAIENAAQRGADTSLLAP